MNTSFFSKYKLHLSSLLILFVIALRLFIGGSGDPSYFIVAGSEFVSIKDMNVSVVIQDGPGYDGQFFYAYSIDPLNKADEINGVRIDHPSYRHQRIVYPLLVWIFSFGQAELVPLSMIVVNALAFFLILYVFNLFCKEEKLNSLYSILPILLSGLWMSLSRDLSEVVESLFVLSSFYFFYKRAIVFYIVSASLAVLTRETSAILLIPISTIWLFHLFKTKASANVIKGLTLMAPFILLFVWKVYIMQVHQADLLTATSNLGIPFVGLWQGFVYNLKNVSDLKTFLEFTFWILFLCWNIWLVVISRPTLRLNNQENLFQVATSISWYLALIFASIYSISIYIDDWAFVRVLSSFNLLALLLLLMKKKPISRYFILYSLTVLSLTLIRLVVRV